MQKKFLFLFLLIFLFVCCTAIAVFATDVGMVTGDVVNVRTGPSTAYEQAGQLAYGTIVTIDGFDEGWFHIVYGGVQGYMHPDYIQVIGTNQDGATDQTVGQQVADYALQFVGYPYVYGGASPGGFDCSGLTSYVYKQFGYFLNRTAAGQGYNGIWVPRNALQPGDVLLFTAPGCGGYVNHAGLYVGNGQMIHASTNTGGVIVSDINTGYYIQNYVAARRIVN